MGFFKDFKRDFAQAVNELMPDKDELANEYDDEDMVNTFDENDNMDIAPEDLLENLDDYTIDNKEQEKEDEVKPEEFYEEEEVKDEENVFDNVPTAEIISETNAEDEGYDESIAQDMVSEFINNETTGETINLEVLQDDFSDSNIKNLEDEIDTFDDEDALFESTPDTNSVDSIMMGDLEKAVEDAISKREDDNTNEAKKIQQDVEEENMAEIEENNAELEASLKEKEQDADSILSGDTTYVTKGTIIKGDIETDGGIDIIGSVEGNVTCVGKLIIGGSVKGNVNAGEVYANAAKIEGEITSEGSVKIGVGSVVVGNVIATSAVVAGAVNGDIDVHGPVIVDSTAVIMGNIKSRSVQINNGAVIEGFCSQCYSDIDVKSFFD